MTKGLVSRSLLILVACAWTTSAVLGQPQKDPWESTIAEFERDYRENPPQPGGILFLGSSSIRLWDLDKYFPDLPVLNRGFGGSQIGDSVRHAHRIVYPAAPSTLVFYAGDNDVAAGKGAHRVIYDYGSFVKHVHSRLPECRIIFIAIKPSLARWNLVETMREANRGIEKLTKTDPRLFFVDVDTPMIGEDGRPRPELFVDDGLHLSAEGYELWSSLLRPLLTPPAGEEVD